MVQGILGLTFRHFELRLHPLMTVADGPKALLRALASLGPGDLRPARGLRLLCTQVLRSNKIHLRDRCRIGNRNLRCKGGILRGIPR